MESRMEHSPNSGSEHRLTMLEESVKSNTNRIDILEQRQNTLDDLVGSVKVLAVREENVENDVKEIKQDVKTLSDKPAKKWDSMTETILAVIITALVTYMLSRIGIR